MSPFIKSGDVITISPINDKSPRNGDVIAYSDPETKKVRVHRVIKKKEASFLVKGDNTIWIDGYIYQKNILGYVSRVDRQGKRVFLGFGPERFLIAFISSNKIFYLSLDKLRKIIGLIKKRDRQHG